VSKIIKVGICGFGLIGQRRFQCLLKNKKYKILGVYDKRIKKNYNKNSVNFYSSFFKLIKLDLDAIYICVTNDVAAQYTIKSLELGLNVFCEKPPAINLIELKKVGKVIKKNKLLKLKYGFNHRYHDSVKDAIKIIKSERLGKIINLRGVYGKSSFEPWKGQGNWRIKRRKSGGGILLDQGIHLVDLMRLFVGGFKEIKSFVSNDFWKENIEDNVYAIMRSDSGIVAMIHSSATQWEHLFELNITLEKGYIYLKGILTGSKSYGKEELISGIKKYRDIDIRVADKNLEKITKNKRKYTKDVSWADEVDEFANCIIYNKPVINGTYYDALATMKLVFDIYKSDNKWNK